MVERLDKPIADEQGGVARPYRAVDTLATMERRGSITAAMRQTGKDFRGHFAAAHLDPLHAHDLSRPRVSGSVAIEPSFRIEKAREAVWRAIVAVGGLASPAGACLWHVVGWERTLKEWGPGTGLDRAAGSNRKPHPGSSSPRSARSRRISPAAADDAAGRYTVATDAFPSRPQTRRQKVAWSSAVGRIEHAVAWWIGDWWAYGKHRYGDRRELVEAEDWLGPAFQTCRDAAWVCGKFETSRRRDVLSFQHHKEVAALPPAAANRLLDWCEETPKPASFEAVSSFGRSAE